MPSAQHEQAARFFDSVSGTYKDKYKERDPFHHYFFNERLEKAVRDLDLHDADVLDIGSGTGDLYDHLVRRFPAMRFHATDVSAGMLAQSTVPAGRKYHGHAYDHPFQVRSFDAVFMLGVTTYLTPEELEKNLAFSARSLQLEGRGSITFSNAPALDTRRRGGSRCAARVLHRHRRSDGYPARQTARRTTAPVGDCPFRWRVSCLLGAGRADQ